MNDVDIEQEGMMNMGIDQKVQMILIGSEVCPMEYICGRPDCSRTVYQNYEDCIKFERIIQAMRRDHHGHYYKKIEHKKEER